MDGVDMIFPLKPADCGLQAGVHMGADQPAAELQWPDGSGRTLLLSLRQQRQQDSMGPATGPGDRGRPAECRRHSLAAADGTTIASHTHASGVNISSHWLGLQVLARRVCSSKRQ